MPCVLNLEQCQNGGTCNNDNLGSYTCTCPSGYKGQNCEISNWNSFSVGEGGGGKDGNIKIFLNKQVRPCIVKKTCQNNGECIEDSLGYSCRCTNGYTGTNCETGRINRIYYQTINQVSNVFKLNSFTSVAMHSLETM